MQWEGRTVSIDGQVTRVALEPQEAKRGGYLFRGVELLSRTDNRRIFLIIPESVSEYGREDLYEFPALCWVGAEIAASGTVLNNTLGDGSAVFVVTPEAELILEPFRPVSVTEAVEAATCIRLVDLRHRQATNEPFWMAKGRMVHGLFDYLLLNGREPSPGSFVQAFREARKAIIEVIPGSRVPVNEQELEDEARRHFKSLKDWLERHRHLLTDFATEVDRVSTRRGLKGRADVVFYGEEGDTIVELKSGRLPTDDHLLQLYAYALLSEDGQARRVHGHVLYSGTGKSEPMRETGRWAILEGRNRVVWMKHSHTITTLQEPGTEQEFSCPRGRRCFVQAGCSAFYGDLFSAKGPFLTGDEQEYYDRWFRLLSSEIWESETRFARVLNQQTLSERVAEGLTVPVMDMTLTAESHGQSRTAANDVPVSNMMTGIEIDSKHNPSPAPCVNGAPAAGRPPVAPTTTLSPVGRTFQSAVNGRQEYLPRRGKGEGVADLSRLPAGAQMLVHFRVEDSFGDVSPGEEVILHGGDPCAWDALRARVIATDHERVSALVRTSRKGLHVHAANRMSCGVGEGHGQWFLDRVPFSRGREVSRQALFRFFMQAAPAEIHAVVSGGAHVEEGVSDADGAFSGPSTARGRGPGQSTKSAARASDGADLCFPEGLRRDLNDEQEDAVRAALEAEPFHLIHGPPGTGKTRVLARLVGMCLDRGERVLVACPTNVALDRLLLALVELGVRQFLRIGGRSSVSAEFLDALVRLGNPPALLDDLVSRNMTLADFKKRVVDTRLIGATAYQCAAHPMFIRQRFDRVVIDEAGQLDEPSSLGVLALAPRFVLGGDHLQLPPVVQGTTGENDGRCSLDRSLFERMAIDADPSRISRLRMQYRMSRDIQELPSRLFYEGALYPAPEVARRRLRIAPGLSDEAWMNRALDPDRPVVFLDVQGPNAGKARSEEAVVAARIVESLTACGVPAQEIGVITPYRVQQALIRQHLGERGRGALSSVDTVDRFQGGEREVIIVSLARSDGVTSFLADRKRLNVSLSRARSKLILLGHAAVLEEHPLFASLLDGMERIPVRVQA